jgi:uncharacterized membrane protein
LWNPKAFLFLVFGVYSIFCAMSEYWTQGQIIWGETNGKLTEIQLNDRIRNKKNEAFLKLTYDYIVDNQKYQMYLEERLDTEFQAETKTKELKETKDVIKIYYDEDNPAETTVYKSATKANDSLLFVLIPTMIMIGGLGYGGLKFVYQNYIKTNS